MISKMKDYWVEGRIDKNYAMTMDRGMTGMGILSFIKKRAIAESKKNTKDRRSAAQRIDDSEYQKNYDFFVNKQCPHCQFQMKQVVKKTDCPSCKKMIVNERHFDSKKQMLLTKEQAEKMAIEKKHYQDVKWAIELAEKLDVSRKEIRSMVASTQVNTKFSVLWVKANDMAMKYAAQGKWQSYRNTRLSMGEIVHRDGHLEKALNFYLAVCFLDANGPDDTGKFTSQGASLKAAVLHTVRAVVKELGFDQEALKKAYLSNANLEKNRLMPLTPEDTWDLFIKEFLKSR